MIHASKLALVPLAAIASAIGVGRSARAELPGVAVVELFTSEGCSSCPPADAALADLVRDSNGKRVFALAFHVDYWNSIGWVDAFSTPAFTARQTMYARLMKLASIYTPQAIVNGTNEFVGSNRATLKQAVDAALAAPATGTLVATAGSAADGATPVDVVATGLRAGTIVNVAYVESGLRVAVRSGENGGRTLPHERVVRAFATATLGAGDAVHVTLAVPADVKRSGGAIVVYAQRPADLAVVAATEVAPRAMSNRRRPQMLGRVASRAEAVMIAPDRTIRVRTSRARA